MGWLTLWVGIVTASAAIIASLVVAIFAFMGLRRQLAHDRKMRMVEARRTAYARLLAVSFDIVTALQYQRIPSRDEVLYRELTDKLSIMQSRVTAAVGEVRLLATTSVEEAGMAMAEAARETAAAAVAAIAHAARLHPLLRSVVARIRPNPYPVAASADVARLLAKLGEATTGFLVAARAELEFA